MGHYGRGRIGQQVTRQYTPEEVSIALTALAAFSGQAGRATQFLNDEKGIPVSSRSLQSWATKHRDEYNAIREKLAPQLEEQLAADLLEVATLATRANHYAIEAAMRRVMSGQDDDPARTAANLARVTQVSTDKMLSLTGRPSRITESRGAEEILRGLVAMGVLKPPEEPEQIDAEVVDNSEEAA